MRILFYLVPVALMPWLLCGCSAPDGDPAPGTEQITVRNDERAALTAGIRFSLTRESDARIKYWPAGSNESEATLSPVSPAGRNHNIPLFALRGNTAYHLRVISGGRESDMTTFTTAAVPENVTAFYDEAQNHISGNPDGCFLFHTGTRPGCAYLVGPDGRLLWYRLMPGTVKALRVTPKNTLLALLDDLDSPFADGNILLETTWAGDTLFHLKLGEKGFDKMAHHDLRMDRDGNYVLITNEQKKGLPGDGLLVLNNRGEKIREWSTFDELTDIDPVNYAQPWGNSLAIDSDGHYIVSFRALSQVWKIHSATGRVLWKLGEQGDFDLPDDDFFLFQHFAHRAGNGEILLFDNGSPQRPLSRAVSYRVDEASHKAVSGIKVTLPAPLYSAIMGSACLLPDGALLMTSSMNHKIIKTGQTGEIAWSINTGGPVYRTEYIDNPFPIHL